MVTQQQVREPRIALVPQKKHVELALRSQQEDVPLDSGHAVGKKHETAEHLRLGERFLLVIGRLARLSKVDLEDEDEEEEEEGGQEDQEVASDRFKQAQEKYGTMPLSPQRSPAKHQALHLNAATEPLHEHLTSEIASMLPLPIDDREPPLASPIKRTQLRRKVRLRRRRRRKRRPRQEWHRSQVTWKPELSEAYVMNHSRMDFVGSSSSLVKNLSNQRVSSKTRMRRLTVGHLPSISRSRSLSSFLSSAEATRRTVAMDDMDDDPGVESSTNEATEEEDKEVERNIVDQEEEEVSSDTTDPASPGVSTPPPDESEFNPDPNPITPNEDSASATEETSTTECSGIAVGDSNLQSFLPTISNSHPPGMDTRHLSTCNQASSSAPQRLFHQPALISSELRAWLLATGMFPTRPGPAEEPQTLGLMKKEKSNR